MGKGRETPQNLAIYERCGAETLQNLRVLSDYRRNPLFFLLLVNLANATYAECMQQFGR
jgi:peroxiredoxin